MFPTREQFSVLLLIGAVLIMGAAVAKAATAYRCEASQLHPGHHGIPKPHDAEALGLRDIELHIANGLLVRGWYIPSHNGAAIVFVHGSPSDRTELLPEARALALAGYGAVLIDVPGHGESTGEATWGQPARDAMRAAVDFVAAVPGIQHIGAYGFSMGSGIVALTAVNDPRIAALVMAGAFTTIEDQLRHEFRSWRSVTVLPALWAARRNGLAFQELRTIDAVARLAPRPIMIVGGTEDPSVPASMHRALYEAAAEPKQLFMIPGARHGHYGEVLGRAYFERLQAFFDASLRSPTTLTPHD